MDEQNEKDALWNLLGQARKIEASPYFTRQVLREVRQQSQRPARSLSVILRWLVPASAVAALVIGWSAFQGQHQPSEEEFNAYFDSAADLQSLVAQEDAAIWITEPGS
ncbi:MAG TPA: hypothetical protein PLS03_16600 [Terrimicrobiaceae bacterium]|nr:hypothetical protein [Terrimicrobiaceae bacterium]